MSAGGGWRVRAQGHPAVRATHARSIELAPEAEIGLGATCVVGVSTEVPEALALARGPLRLTLTADGHAAALRAWRSPSWASERRIVVRTTTHADGDTFAIGATAGAADLDRRLVEALRQGTALTVAIHPLSPPPPLVVAAPSGTPFADLPAGLRRHLTAASHARRLFALVPPRGHRDAAPWSELGGEPTTSLEAVDDGAVVLAPDSERLLLRALDGLDDGRRERLRLLVQQPSHPAHALLLLCGAPATPALALGILPERPQRRRRLLTEALRTGLPAAFACADHLSSELASEAAALAPEATIVWAAAEPDFGEALSGPAQPGLVVPSGLRRGVLLSGSSPRRPAG